MPTRPANRVINYSRRDSRLGITSGHETGGGRSGFPTCSRRWRFLTPRAVLGPGGWRRAASGGRRPVPTLPACGPMPLCRQSRCRGRELDGDDALVPGPQHLPGSAVRPPAVDEGSDRCSGRHDLPGRGPLPDPLAGPDGSCDFRVTRFPQPVLGQTTRRAASRLCDSTVSIRSQSDARGARAGQRCWAPAAWVATSVATQALIPDTTGRHQMKSVPYLGSQDGAGRL
jgi:hypothetical protein